MSVLGLRGGVPLIFRSTAIPASPGDLRHSWSRPNGGWTNYLIARNKGANVIRMYFNQADNDAAAGAGNAKYIEVPVAAAGQPYGEWKGPVESREIWLKGIGGLGDIELVGFQRRG